MKKYFEICINGNCEKDTLKKLLQDFELQIQFMTNKYKLKLENSMCNICFKENIDIIPYDCFGHYYCETCYLKMNKCPMCKIKKHEIMM